MSDPTWIRPGWSTTDAAELRAHVGHPRKWAHDIEEALKEPYQALVFQREELAALAELLRELGKRRERA